jgi:hypothetical protein
MEAESLQCLTDIQVSVDALRDIPMARQIMLTAPWMALFPDAGIQVLVNAILVVKEVRSP